MNFRCLVFTVALETLLFISFANADENLFGYLRGAEPLPKGSWEFYQILTSRTDKGVGTYRALDSETEIEFGKTDRLTLIASLQMQSIYSKGILIDAYIPKDIDSGASLSGIEVAAKYNFLSAAKDEIGFSTYLALSHAWLDRHSGQKKDATSLELDFLVQKYFLEGEVIWVGNVGMESTYAQRYSIQSLPADYEWPTHPEMEISLKAGTGISYRFLPKWFLGWELIYATEYETEVGQERWSTFSGPNVHYGSEKWWGTFTWFSQLEGGGPPYANQTDTRLHLIEKTKQEARLKIGFNY